MLVHPMMHHVWVYRYLIVIDFIRKKRRNIFSLQGSSIDMIQKDT